MALILKEVSDRLAGDGELINDIYSFSRDVLKGISEARNLPMYGRIKAPESLSQKIETGRYATWQELDDVIAFTIIMNGLMDEIGLVEEISRRFPGTIWKMRGQTRKKPELFRFDTTRGYARIEETHKAGLNQYQIEIQLRTAFEHAWQVVTHDLVYKGNMVTWERCRLAAQMRSAIEQLDLLAAEFDSMAGSIARSPDRGVDDLCSCVEWLATRIADGDVAAASAPRDIIRVGGLIRDVFERVDVDIGNGLVQLLADLRANGGMPGSLTVGQTMVALVCKRHGSSEQLRRLSFPTERIDDFFGALDVKSFAY